MRIHDTFSDSEKELEISGTIRIYLCGVTVYDEAHIGHARTIIVFDILRKFLESQDLKVKFVQNFTDVDDKIINKAKAENKTTSEISEKYIKNYFEDFDGLNVKRATEYPKATEHIKEMQDLVKDLVDKEIAYKTENGVYFSVEKFKEYGKLSKKKIEDLVSGSRIEIDEEKNDPLDFALWKFSESEPTWDSQWGKGRPGWHIECSAMSKKYLGDEFEIHGGGRDLIFPHHENEIAQSKAHSGKIFAKIWMHVGMVTIEGVKMSKSLGNIKSVRNLLKELSPNVIRLFCIGGHYSKPIDYSISLLTEHETNWNKAMFVYHKLFQAENDGKIPDDVVPRINELVSDFDNALNSDLNTHLALKAFYQLCSFSLGLEEKLTIQARDRIIPVFEKMMMILGLKIDRFSKEKENEIKTKIKLRNEHRNNKKFEDADKIRKELVSMGVELKDETTQTIWIKKEKIGVES